MNKLLGVLGTQEMLIISIVLLFVMILPVVIAYRLGKKAGKSEAIAMQNKNF